MCSLKLPEALFGLDGAAAIQSAVADVTERSFFAMAEVCEDARFVELAAGQDEWLEATVRFNEGSFDGSVCCTLPIPLAERLFDAFSGRESDEPGPDGLQLVDLAGELANMICGAWLTRAANRQTFDLSKPDVRSRSGGWKPADAAHRGLTLTIDDWPLIVDVDVAEIRTQSASALTQA